MEILKQNKPNKGLLIILALFAVFSAGFSAPVSSTRKRAATNLNPSTAINEPTVDIQSTLGFYITGSKWNVTELSYEILTYPRQLGKDDVDNEIAKAFALWTAQTDLSITQKKTGRAHINIRFEEGQHGDGIPFDGPGRSLGHAYFPMRGDTHFDGAEQWSVTAEEGETNLFSVAAHLIGHALGLGHSREASAVMAPYYHGSITLQLDHDDIKGIQALYGQKKAVAPVAIPEN